MSKRRPNPPLSRSSTYARWGGVVGKGSVVNVIGAHGEKSKGVVVRLLPLDNFSRAYGRQAIVEFYEGKSGRVYEREVGVGDMQVIGRVKRLPRTHTVTVPPDAAAVAHHERIRDTRREGQGVYYDPNAEYNRVYEKPLPGHRELRVTRRRRRS